MVVTLGENAPSYSVEKNWDPEFKRGRESLEDDPRGRRPFTLTTQETITMTHDITMADRQVTKYYNATELGIYAVTQNEFHTSKVSAHPHGHGCYSELWIPTCPYSPDLAPSDCYLVLKMKKELDGDNFARDDDVMNELWTNFLRVENGAFYTRDLFAP